MKQVRPKKNLGQHFLTDLNIAKRIADTVDACPDIPVLEIGPGMGVLTQYLVEKPREVKAVEIDSESVRYLYEKFPKLRDNILGEDFLRMDLTKVFDGKPFVLTGNYPYDISSQIFFKMLDNKEPHSLLYGNDSARGRSTHRLQAGFKAVWHPQRDDPGMVRHGVSLHR